MARVRASVVVGLACGIDASLKSSSFSRSSIDSSVWVLWSSLQVVDVKLMGVGTTMAACSVDTVDG